MNKLFEDFQQVASRDSCWTAVVVLLGFMPVPPCVSLVPPVVLCNRQNASGSAADGKTGSKQPQPCEHGVLITGAHSSVGFMMPYPA